MQNGVQKIRVNMVGHVCVFVGCVCLHPNKKPHWPAPGELRAAPHPGAAAFSSLRSLSLRRPRMGRSDREKPNYRRNFTPPNFDDD